MKKRTQEEFIQLAKEVYPEYDYSLVEYKNSTTKIKVVCPIHGEFETVPSSLLQNHGCFKCSCDKLASMFSKSQEEFVQQAKEVRPEYDYSLVEYKNNKTKVKIICPVHGEFEIRPDCFLNKFHQGCPKCGETKRNKNITKPQEDFIQQAKEIHPEYDYNLVEYKNSKTKVKIICPAHGEYKVSPNGFLRGNICPVCSLENRRKSQEEFVQQAKKIHPEYDYAKTNYINKRTKVIVSCLKHGDFLASPDGLLKGVGCPRCCSSKGEKGIRRYLQENKVLFKEQYKIADCKNKKPLPFDFAVLNKDGSLAGLIEYQGKQHYVPVDFFGGEKTFSYLQTNDTIKRNYCYSQVIPYIEVSYRDDTISCLDKFFRFIKNLQEN